MSSCSMSHVLDICCYHILHLPPSFIFFFFNDTATTEIYTLSLHDALPIFPRHGRGGERAAGRRDRLGDGPRPDRGGRIDRKSTRLNSSHGYISYAVFCLKKKKKKKDENENIAA